jgi:hypothetical protein
MFRKLVLAMVLLGWPTPLGGSVPSSREVTRLGPDHYTGALVGGTSWEMVEDPVLGMPMTVSYTFAANGSFVCTIGANSVQGTWRQEREMVSILVGQAKQKVKVRTELDVIESISLDKNGTGRVMTLRRQSAKE